MISDQVLDSEYWSDIFDGIVDKVSSPSMIPLKYIFSVSIMFKNGRKFELPVTNLDDHWDSFSETLTEFLLKYEGEVISVSYDIDLSQIKEDISTTTHQFLTHYNL